MTSPARLLLALCATLGASFATLAPVQAAEPELLRIIGEDKKFIVQTAKGPLEITRTMTPCAKNKGWLQPLVPVAGVHPIGEIEILHALNDRDSMLIDMRESQDRVNGTIPNSYHIPYTEVAGRMDELGCKKLGKGWDCSSAKKVYAFCNGPVCPQSPTAILAMTRDGFPADKIYYYRGGMLDWEALGFPVIKGEF
jgi:rhodanese-related sulfurtransferase